MLRQIAGFAGAVFLLLAPVGEAVAQAKQDFSLVNATGYPLRAVFVAPSKSDDWEDDVLGKDIMADGETVDIHFNRADKSCGWDLKVTYDDDGTSAVWYGIDLCTVSRITIKYNRATDTSTATYD